MSTLTLEHKLLIVIANLQKAKSELPNTEYDLSAHDAYNSAIAQLLHILPDQSDG